MFKEMMFRKMLEKELSALPPQQRQRVIEAMTQNPEFFSKIGERIQEKTAQGMDKMQAAQEVALENKAELERLLAS